MDNLTSPEARTLSLDWPFWFSWVAASTAAILLGFGIIYVLIFIAKAVLPGINEDKLFGGLTFPILATVLGASQWLVLRTRVFRSGWWIFATGVGMLVGITLGRGVVQAISHSIGQQWDPNSQPAIFAENIAEGYS